MINAESSYHILLIEERKDGGPAPFSAVQDQVKIRLMEERRRNLKDKALKDIRSRHYIETIFDEPKQ